MAKIPIVYAGGKGTIQVADHKKPVSGAKNKRKRHKREEEEKLALARRKRQRRMEELENTYAQEQSAYVEY